MDRFIRVLLFFWSFLFSCHVSPSSPAHHQQSGLKIAAYLFFFRGEVVPQDGDLCQMMSWPPVGLGPVDILIDRQT